MTKLQLNKQEFLNAFLLPLSRVHEECRIQITKNSIYSLVSNADGSIIINSNINADFDIEDSLTLNIKDVTKLIRVIECIPSNEFTLSVDKTGSVLKHTSPGLSFSLHLVNDRVLAKSRISKEQVEQLEYSHEFTVPGSKIQEVLKGAIFASESNKIYFYSRDRKIHAELTNRAESDHDSITFSILDEYDGASITPPLPFNIDALRIVAANRPDNIQVRINTKYKLLSFTINHSNGVMQYLVPALTK